MFNYLGPNMGPSTVAGSLPSGVPGTVPSAIPGVTPMNAVGSVSPTGSVIPSRPVIPQGPLPPALAAAVQSAHPGGLPMPPAPPGPQDDHYIARTQEDGSIALHVKKPDGSMGPIVKIIPPITHPGNKDRK